MAEKIMADEEKMALDYDIAAALIEAAEYNRGEQRKINIRRGGKLLFTFVIESVSSEKWDQARRENTKNKGKRNEELDSSRYLSQVIYFATVDKSIWKNQSVMRKLNAPSPVDVVNAVLSPGEKMKLGEILEEISGFGEENLESLIENF